MKVCPKCQKKKQLGEFNTDRSRPDGKASYCRPCHRASRRETYRKHRKKHEETSKRGRAARLEKIRAYVREYLLAHPCVDCDETNPVVLEFDHVRGKKDVAVSVMIGKVFGLERIKKEIAKCDVRCANCHRKRTAKEGGWWLAV